MFLKTYLHLNIWIRSHFFLLSAAKGAMAALGMTTGKPGEVREDKIGTMNRLMMPKVLGDFLEPQTPFKWSPGKAWASRDAPEWPNRDSPGSVPDGTGTFKFDRSGIFLLSELGQRATENGPAPMTEMQGPQDTRQPSSFFDPDLKVSGFHGFQNGTPFDF